MLLWLLYALHPTVGFVTAGLCERGREGGRVPPDALVVAWAIVDRATSSEICCRDCEDAVVTGSTAGLQLLSAHHTSPSLVAPAVFLLNREHGSATSKRRVFRLQQPPRTQRPSALRRCPRSEGEQRVLSGCRHAGMLIMWFDAYHLRSAVCSSCVLEGRGEDGYAMHGHTSKTRRGHVQGTCSLSCSN